MIVIRRRFPNFVCDGRPYGYDEEKYLHRLQSTEEFFEIDWVKELWLDQNSLVEFCVVGKEEYDPADRLFAVIPDGSTNPEWHVIGWVVEGSLDFATYVDFEDLTKSKFGAVA